MRSSGEETHHQYCRDGWGGGRGEDVGVSVLATLTGTGAMPGHDGGGCGKGKGAAKPWCYKRILKTEKEEDILNIKKMNFEMPTHITFK